jgi:crotonobetainyl-CoA:carnitine CoA-transferase CaiB-like acyl-CoA transferase
VPFAPINSVDAAVKDPQARHLGLTVPIEAPQTARHAIRPAVQFDGQRAASVRAAPLLGEQTVPVRQAVSGSHGWPAA